MKLQFKVQAYQTNAVQMVVDCFAGQVNTNGIKYRLDPGTNKKMRAKGPVLPGIEMEVEQSGFKNADVQLSETQLLSNIQAVQQKQNLPLSASLVSSAGCKINLDVEMETGTGKTYCYIKTIFEMNTLYGWTKFIVVVPSIAIREGVLKSFEITEEHFIAKYGKKIRSFVYNSKALQKLESFSSDAGINVMIINSQAFAVSLNEDKNAQGRKGNEAARIIFNERDDFASRRPIDVISSNRPILILDEPQKMEGKKTLAALAKFKPLMILRYSATHRTSHNKIHRLDAVDAYNQKLVKKIAVRGIKVRGLSGTNAYLYLESIEISKQAPVARIEIEVRQKSGIKRIVKRLKQGTSLFDESNELDQYRDNFVISQIDATTDTVEFLNGLKLTAGEATGDVTESTLRRIQIRETIQAHLEKERQLFTQGIKVLSLFFIDEVAKYRDYSREDAQGEYARIFEEEYELLKKECLEDLDGDNDGYRKYLNDIPTGKTHRGYFSIDKKNRLVDPKVKKRGEGAGLSDDVSAYDLILKAKERLLSFEEPVRFIFSHSALREGWDNPNVFGMCMLKHSDNTISRRQEVGRGLRLCVNQTGERMDNPATVHETNILTVVANESYNDFVSNLQREISDTLSERPRKADIAYFIGKSLATESGSEKVTDEMARKIHHYLARNDYADYNDQITQTYLTAKETGRLSSLPEDLAPYGDQIFNLIDSVFSDAQLHQPENGRKSKRNPLNANFHKKEFKELWNRINHKAVYRVDFDSNELIQNCIRTLDQELTVTPLQYTIQAGEQEKEATYEDLKSGQAFMLRETNTEQYTGSIYSMVSYDLVGKIAENTQLTRRTIAEILSGITEDVFSKFKQNPEHFIAEAGRLIGEQKATIIIERLSYDETEERFDSSIFTAGETLQNFSKAGTPLNRHIYDYVVTDSDVERNFVKELDTSNEVVVYAKLPKGFYIPTPVGHYNPDWAISFKEGSVKHVYFVAETKGSMSTMHLRAIEAKRIDCARKFFEKMNQSLDGKKVKYDVVTDYGKLMDIVGVGTGE